MCANTFTLEMPLWRMSYRSSLWLFLRGPGGGGDREPGADEGGSAHCGGINQ